VSFGPRASIRLDALAHNFERLRNASPGSRVLAAVKANAYGHGLIGISRALTAADALAVARLCEADQLREAGIDTDIVVMGGVITAAEQQRAEHLGCDLVVHSEYQVELLERGSQSFARVWLKIDTGMRRLGVRPADSPDLLARLRRVLPESCLGVMTHLANADALRDPDMTRRQFEAFAAVASNADVDISIANSAALLGWRDRLADAAAPACGSEAWIRPGISLFGISPLAGVSARDLGLLPVMNFDTTLIAVKPLAAGEPVGYGGTWRSGRDTMLGIAAAGYGDGYSRIVPSGTPVLVNGRRVGLAGVVSMDLLAVDLGPGATDRIGDPVRLWGEGLPVEEIAGHAGTTAYALVTGVRDRRGELR